MKFRKILRSTRMVGVPNIVIQKSSSSTEWGQEEREVVHGGRRVACAAGLRAIPRGFVVGQCSSMVRSDVLSDGSSCSSKHEWTIEMQQLVLLFGGKKCVCAAVLRACRNRGYSGLCCLPVRGDVVPGGASAATQGTMRERKIMN